jgi:hypothetical protein
MLHPYPLHVRAPSGLSRGQKSQIRKSTTCACPSCVVVSREQVFNDYGRVNRNPPPKTMLAVKLIELPFHYRSFSGLPFHKEAARATVKGAAAIQVASRNVAGRTCQSNPRVNSAQSQKLVCGGGANHSNLAKTDSNQDNVKPLGMEAKSIQKRIKTEIRNLSLISTI